MIYRKNVSWNPAHCYFALHNGVDNAGVLISPGSYVGRHGSRFAATFIASHSPAAALWQSLMTTGAHSIVWAVKFVVLSFGINTSLIVISNSAGQTITNMFFRTNSQNDVSITWTDGGTSWDSRVNYIPRLGQITNYVFAKIGGLGHHFVNGRYLGVQSVSITPRVFGSPGNVVFCTNPGSVFLESAAFWALSQSPSLNELLHISRDVSAIFRRDNRFKGNIYVPSAAYPTLSDLKAVNISASSVQATVDYAF